MAISPKIPVSISSETEDVAVIIDVKHLCVSIRGIEDTSSAPFTAHYSGKFKDENVKAEFFKYIN